DYSQTGSDLTEAELNRWAQKAEARLQAELAAAKKMVNAARTKTKGIQDAMQNIADQLAASQKALSARMESLAQCEASCKNMDELNRTLEDVSVLTPPTSFEPSGYFCSIPVIRSVTCGEDDNEGWMCNTFNLFCPEEEFFIDDALACITGASSSLCDSIGTEPQFFIEGALGTEFPLIISGMDGDINALQHCLSNGPEDCTGLDFGLPGEDILFGNDFLNADPGDFHLGVHGPNDDGFLLGDPIDSDLINVGGGSNDILFGGPVALSDDLIGPGDDSILGGPPSVDILGDPPPQSEPSVANDPRARQVAQAAVDAYLQRNPLQPCEKLVVSVSRVRIGKRVRYTVKITRDRDEALCPKQCTKDGGFENMAACQSACPDPSRCGYDGGTCWLCNRGDESSCQKDNGFNSMEACRAGCNNPESCGYDGSLCYVCGLYDDDDRDLCKDVECDDGDECTEDACNPDTGECTNTPIDGCGDPECGNGVVEAGEECESNVDCKFDQQCNPESCACERMEIISNAKCPDLSYATQNECRQACSGSCQYKQYEDIWCFFCYSEDLWGGSSSSKRSVDEQCDSPMKKKADCERSCDGKCHKSYTTISGLECYECQEVQPVCGDGTFIDECPSSCSSGCDVASSQNGVTCYQCAQSCEDVCSQNGYHTEDYDHSSAILSELNGYSCVSGANISIQTATIGSCHCIGEYSLSVNQTPPVCTGTPCGDVTCNSSASCTDGDTTITVNCSWGGWEKIGKEQFRPKVGN
ncbi:MAG: hypothetical protein KC680_02355, partial [Candidatus Peregrinibacteria bacterium]|nr:hypothetical protein [Candidatus Peregrinibacteria bacterium]